MNVLPKTPEEIHALGVAMANGEALCGLHLLIVAGPMEGALLMNRVFLAVTFLSEKERAQWFTEKWAPYQYLDQQVGNIGGQWPGFIDNEWLTYTDACRALDVASSYQLNQ